MAFLLLLGAENHYRFLVGIQLHSQFDEINKSTAISPQPSTGFPSLPEMSLTFNKLLRTPSNSRASIETACLSFCGMV